MTTQAAIFPHTPSKATPHPMESTDTILFYDGTCGFCSTSIQFILRHEHRHWLRFATLQGPLAASLRDRHPELHNVDSVVWYEPATPTRKERLLVRSSAGLAAAAYMGGIWRILAIPARLIPRFIRDAVYNLIARNRHSLVKNAACMLPTPEQRARFIDGGRS